MRCFPSASPPRVHPLGLFFCFNYHIDNPFQCSCLENPRDGGAWWAAVYGVAKSRTRLKRLSSSSSSRLHCYLVNPIGENEFSFTSSVRCLYLLFTYDSKPYIFFRVSIRIYKDRDWTMLLQRSQSPIFQMKIRTQSKMKMQCGNSCHLLYLLGTASARVLLEPLWRAACF